MSLRLCKGGRKTRSLVVDPASRPIVKRCLPSTHCEALTFAGGYIDAAGAIADLGVDTVLPDIVAQFPDPATVPNLRQRGGVVEVAERAPRPAAGRHIPVRRDIQPMPGCPTVAVAGTLRRGSRGLVGGAFQGALG